jgi:hypothetical protein
MGLIDRFASLLQKVPTETGTTSASRAAMSAGSRSGAVRRLPGPIACFLCDNDIERRVRDVLPDMMRVPRCRGCFGLPPMLRWARALRSFEENCPGVHFNFVR